jgi:hypothetical protein
MMSTLAVEKRGWSRGGVQGWVFTDEVQDHMAGVNLKDLLHLGMVVREDVCDPGRRLPLYLHRITQVGEDEVATADGRVPISIPASRGPTPADRETLYVPASAWAALAALARAPMEEPWHSLAEIAARAKTQVLADALDFLVARGLVEIQRPAVPSRTTPNLYRATALGRGARALKRRGERVQIRVPGLILRHTAVTGGGA